MKLDTRTGRVWARWLTVLLLAVPQALHAHGHLRVATPAAGASLAEAPGEIRLSFSEAPELAETTVELWAANGAAVALGALGARDSRTVVAHIEQRLAPGEYRVVWRMVAADGHPTHGEYRFTVLATSQPAAARTGPPPGAAGLGATGPAAHTATPPQGRRATPARHDVLDASAPPFVAIRFLMYLAVISLIGAVVFRLLVLGRLATRRAGLTWLEGEAARAAARIGLLAATTLLVVEVGRLLAQSVALNGGAALEPGRLGTLLGRTHWGATWLLQLAATAVAWLGFRLAITGRRAGWPLAAVAAAALALATALAGHARVTSMPALAVAADTLHVAGASGWLGSLAATIAAGVVVALRGPERERAAAVAALVDAFSPTALACAGLTAFTGVIAARFQVEHLAALTGTAYGRVLLLKLGILAGVGLVGAYNWLRVKPALGTDLATARLRRSATFELAVGALVVLATAVLVGLPAPASM